MKNLFISFVVFVCASASYASYPSSFSNAKSKAEKEVYFDRHLTFYCGCDFVFDDVHDIDGDRSETKVLPTNCGYTPRNPFTKKGKENLRVSRIEWEHIMPAALFGNQLDEWKNKENYPQCKKANGKYLSGRDCAYKTVPAFKRAHDDMNNLVPAVGELNGDRSDYSYGVIAGEPRVYGACDFEIDTHTDIAEPADNVKGNIARVYFHMIKEHGAHISDEEMFMMKQWDALDPVDSWECERNERIEKAQGMGNSFVKAKCP